MDRNTDRNGPNLDRIGLSDGARGGPKDRKTENRSETEVSVRSGPFDPGTSTLDGTETGSPEGQFLKLLADGESVRSACRVTGLARSVLYLRRETDRAFAAAWDAALAGRPIQVADAIYDSAVNGEPVIDAKGNLVGFRRNTRLLERLGERHGVLPVRGPETALQVNVGALPAPGHPDTPESVRERIRAALHGDVIEGEAVEVAPHPPEDGSDLV
jgi:hypothetical protein